MPSDSFQPGLSDRFANLVKDQKWQAYGPEATIESGNELAKRLYPRMGNIVQQMLDTPVGGCLKTGVSAYERIA